MTDSDPSHFRDNTSRINAENSENQTPVEMQKEIERLHKELKKQSSLIDVLSAKLSINPDEFMNFDVFCRVLSVTKREYKPLLDSLRTDEEFYEVSEQTRRLFGRTGIAHLFKIRESVAQLASSNKRKARKNDA